MRSGIGSTKSALFAAALALVMGVGAPVAVAQQYPPPTPTKTPKATKSPKPTRSPKPAKTSNPSCFVVSGETDDGFVRNEVEYLGDLRLEGAADCAEPNGDVTFTVESDPVTLGTVQAFEDGSFKATYALPASVQPGDHTVFADIEGRGELQQPLLVTGGTAVGGVSETNDDGGVLPRTGGGIALLVMWALALVALGTLLVKATRRRFAAARAGHHGAVMEIPLVDTSRFVPYRSRTNGSAAKERNLTEWDAYGSERPPS